MSTASHELSPVPHGPDRKRARPLETEEDEEKPDIKTFVDHPNLYFLDGDVIIKCDVGQALFRVHRATLAEASPVLDTLAKSAVDRKESYLRGCPCLTVNDDEGHVQIMLDAIYNIGPNALKFTTASFHVVSALLWMCTKYHIVRFRAQLIEQLERHWPSTLQDHIAKNTTISTGDSCTSGAVSEDTRASRQKDRHQGLAQSSSGRTAVTSAPQGIRIPEIGFVGSVGAIFNNCSNFSVNWPMTSETVDHSERRVRFSRFAQVHVVNRGEDTMDYAPPFAAPRGAPGASIPSSSRPSSKRAATEAITPIIRAIDGAMVQPAHIISLLRRCDYTSSALLAPLFYDLSRRLGKTGEPTLHISALSRADLERLLLGVQNLRTAQLIAMCCPIHRVNCPCTPIDCSQLDGVKQYWDRCVVPKLTDPRDGGIHSPIEKLSILIALADHHLKEYDVCSGCRAAVIESMKKARKDMWDSLSSSFGLDG